jgi:hypothetical protein
VICLFGSGRWFVLKLIFVDGEYSLDDLVEDSVLSVEAFASLNPLGGAHLKISPK